MIDHLASRPETTKESFESGLVLVEFYARGCGICRALTRTLASVEPIVGIPIVRVDIDDDPALAVRYDVLGVPQLLLLKDGIETARASGSLDESEFAEWYSAARIR